MPPEMFKLECIPNKKCDVYAYGVVLWEIFTEKMPYEGKYDNILSLTLAVTQNNRPDIPDKFTPTLSHLIMDCWDGNPERRPDFSTILSEDSDYFNKITCEWIANGQNLISNFWSEATRNYGSEEVPWDEFKKVFSKIMNILPENPKYGVPLRAVQILLDAVNGPVRHSSFYQFVQWFSPIQAVPQNQNGRSTFDEIVSLLSQPWFFGKLSANKATRLLENVKPRTYLVRFSENQGSSFTVSIRAKETSKEKDIKESKKESSKDLKENLSKDSSKSKVQHYRLEGRDQNIPIVTAIFNLIKKVQGKYALSEKRPAEYVALFNQGMENLYIENQYQQHHIPNAEPWQSTKVIF